MCSATQVPRRSTLDGFTLEASSTDGVNIEELAPLTTVSVRTMNSLYRIITLQFHSVCIIVQGGQFFPEQASARLVGSTFGGTMIKMAWIGVGMHMEFHTGETTIVTSRVRSVMIEPDPPALLPH
jgi:hypothetical protein